MPGHCKARKIMPNVPWWIHLYFSLEARNSLISPIFHELLPKVLNFYCRDRWRGFPAASTESNPPTSETAPSTRPTGALRWFAFKLMSSTQSHFTKDYYWHCPLILCFLVTSDPLTLIGRQVEENGWAALTYLTYWLRMAYGHQCVQYGLAEAHALA